MLKSPMMMGNVSREKVKEPGGELVNKGSGRARRSDGNQGKHRVTKRGPALSYPMFTLVTSKDIAESDIMDSISKSISEFSFDLANELRNSESDKNIAVSPTSISAILSLLLLGSTGKTSAQIQKVLHFPEDQTAEKEGFGKLCAKKNEERQEVSFLSQSLLNV
ncbi:unnamed protein product [Ranitomeya imitator]|uniref:Serpin domain-containing protein n=1 Tax=Ranitomeya imitator TaxID=111125 RepID=A0ABN9KYC9_9NEOB|nr:unnamed protein product [Ranitomeya imitator]